MQSVIPTAAKAFRDEFYDNVVFQCHCDGTDASTSFVDKSKYARTVTANGNAQVDTAQSKFGGASLLCDGAGDYLEVTSAASLNVAASDFTMEAFVRINTATTQKCILGKWSDTGPEFIWEVNSATPRFWWAPNSVGAAWLTSSSTLSTGTWYHLAVRRSGSSFNMYIDGSSVASGTNSGNAGSGTNPLRVGIWGRSGYGPYWPMDGWIDEIRFTIGSARTITVPTQAYPDG